MRLTKNELFVYRGRFDHACRCHLRVWEEDGKPPIVVFSQLPRYDGPSVTNRIEHLAWEVYTRLGKPAQGLTIFEHYAVGTTATPQAEALQFVTCTRTSQGFCNPVWRQAERAEVERMIGQPFHA